MIVPDNGTLEQALGPDVLDRLARQDAERELKMISTQEINLAVDTNQMQVESFGDTVKSIEDGFRIMAVHDPGCNCHNTATEGRVWNPKCLNEFNKRRHGRS